MGRPLGGVKPPERLTDPSQVVLKGPENFIATHIKTMLCTLPGVNGNFCCQLSRKCFKILPMKFPRRRGFAPLLIFLLATPLSPLLAQTQEFTLPQCLSMAESKSPQTIKAELQALLARQQKQEALRNLLPVVYAIGGYTETNSPLYAPILDNSENGAVGVSYDGFPFSPKWYERERLAALSRAAQYAKIQTKQDVALTVESLYFSILNNQDAVADLDKVENRFNRLRLTVIPRYTMGRAPPFDLIQVKSSLADLARLRDLLSVQLETDETQLALILGLSPNKGLTIKPISALPAIPRFSYSQVEGSPALASLKAQADAAKMGLKEARGQRYPQLVANYQYGYGGPTMNDTIVGHVLSVGLRLNIFDWGQISSRIRQNRTSVSLADNALTVKDQALTVAFDRANAQAQADLAEMKRLEALLPESRRSAQSTVERYRRGATTILEATGAMQIWLNALLGERAAYYSYLQDLATMQDLTGQGGPAAANIYE